MGTSICGVPIYRMVSCAVTVLLFMWVLLRIWWVLNTPDFMVCRLQYSGLWGMLICFWKSYKKVERLCEGEWVPINYLSGQLIKLVICNKCPVVFGQFIARLCVRTWLFQACIKASGYLCRHQWEAPPHPVGYVGHGEIGRTLHNLIFPNIRPYKVNFVWPNIYRVLPMWDFGI